MKTLKYQLIAILSLAFCIAQAQSPAIGEVLTASDGTAGVVFYVSPDGNTCWMAAMNDLDGTYQWGPYGDIPELENYNSANDEIWYDLHYEPNGLENTSIMFHNQGYNSNYPASLINFKHGWHIPSTGQLSKLYAALPYVNHVFTQNGGTEMTYDYYWASTESSSQQAWAVNFDDNSYKGGFLQEFDKLTRLHVRPIWSSEIISSSPTVGQIAAPEAICSGNSLDLQTPSTQHATSQGWQIAADENFTDYQSYNGEALDESFDGWYLRYFASNHLGTTYSNTVRVTVMYAPSSSFSIESCGPYVWNGATYTENGIYQQNFPMPNGCDSIATLYLSIGHEYDINFNASSCESYTWNGQTYTQSGDYTQVFTSIYGCDSIATLHLSIYKSAESELSITECDSYVWNGQTYTTSGDYTQILHTTHGCDSLVTLHLTIESFEEMQAIEGDAAVDTHITSTSIYSQPGFNNSTIYQWVLLPDQAGTVAGFGNTAIVTWSTDYQGDATLGVGIDAPCGEGFNTLTLNVKNSSDVSENSINAKLYPNPTSGTVTIEAADMQRITVANTMGQVVVDMELDASTASIDMTQFGTGVYVVRIMTKGGSCIRRIGVE